MFISPESISSLIVEVVKQSESISGVELGKAVHRGIPNVNLSPYGGLNKFIRAFCSQDIAFNRVGEDYIYTLKSEGGDVYHADASSEPQLSAWLAFSNPKNTSPLLVNNLTGEILIGAAGDASAEGYTQLLPMTSEDYRIIARDFLPLVTDETLRDELQQDLLAEDFWSSYSSRLRRHDEAFAAWGAWRIQKVQELFRTMLGEAGLSDETIELAMEHLEQSAVKKPKPPTHQTSRAPLLKIHPTSRTARRGTNNTPSDRNYSRQPTAGGEDTTSALHTVIHEAIDTLSEGDLRRIWLPIGAVLDALNKNSS